MISITNIKDSETQTKDYKKSNPTKNNYYKKLHAIKPSNHSLDKVYTKGKANNTT